MDRKEEDFNLKWTWTWDRAKVTSDEQWVNHFPNSGALTSKDTLYEHLRKTYPMDVVHSMVPPTFALDKPEERAAFLAFASNKQDAKKKDAYPDAVDLTAASPQHSGVFVAKPARGARGVGIQIFRDANELLAFVDEAKAPYVAQEYLHPPLLYNGLHKFDLRVFALVTSVQPVNAYIYAMPYARLCSGIYSMDNLTDPYVHLTNHQVQKHSGLQEVTPFNQLAPADVRALISPHRNWNRHFWPSVRKLIAKTLLAWPKQGHRPNTFELVGCDVLVDGNVKPWLIEVNRAPGLHMITPIVKDLHPKMVDDMFAVVFDEPRTSDNKWEQIVKEGEVV